MACDDGRGGAEAAAKQLASAVAGLDLRPVAFDGRDSSVANDQLKLVFKALEPEKPSVEAGELELDGDTARVPLNYSWKIASGEWKYTVSADLRKSGDKWLTVWSPGMLVPDLAEGEILSKSTQSPQRADILGAQDTQLVTYRPVVNVGIDKPQLGTADAAESATKLAKLVGIDPAAYVQQVEASGAEAFVPAITLRDTSSRTVTDAQIEAIPGGRAIQDKLPLAPTRSFARAVLGTVGEASAEQIEKSDGALTAGDVTGTGGLQQQYDAQLRGKDGIVVRVQRADLTQGEIQAPTDPRRTVFQIEATPGTPLKTTLDLKLQQLAEDTLAGVKPASAIVALRPSTGAVLAAASGPGSNGYNTAMLGQYAPGSTFKVVDSLAMLRNGLTPDSKVNCTPTLTVDGRKFKNAEGYPADSLGSVTLRDAFAHSCNTAFISMRDKVSQAQLESAATSLGVAVEAPKLGADAFLGSVPGEAEGTDHAAAMIGQGRVLMSPLAAAIMAGSVAKGSPVSPVLVQEAAPGASSSASGAAGTQPAEGASPSSTVTAEAPAKAAETPITKAEAASLADMMRAVVTSGHAGFLADLPGEPVGAKTGTAEYGKANPPKTHAWIIAVHGDLAVAVFVEDGGLGATTSGPLLKKFLAAAG